VTSTVIKNRESIGRSAESERECLDAGIEELDFEGPILDEPLTGGR
jgi:hypothetical protein